MTLAVTTTGFSTELLQEWLDAINADQLGSVDPNLNQQPDSVIQILNGIVAANLAEVSDVLQALYGNLFESASGIYLDRICALTGVTRLPATASSVTLTVTGTPGAVIPAGRTVRAPALGTKWTTADDVTLDGSGNGTVLAVCTVTGATNANAGTITRIDTPVAGWSTVTNALDAVPGRDAESDASLRLRRRVSLLPSAAGAIAAIRTQLLAPTTASGAACTSASVYQNPSAITDANGIPPHTVEAIVEGGNDTTIAQVLARTVAAGIGTYGNQTPVVITDAAGGSQTFKFSRPVTTEIKVALTVHIDQSTYPGDAALKTALQTYVNALLSGQPVVWSKVQALVSDFAGVTDASSVQIALAAGSLGTSNVHMTPRQVANLQSSNITITSTTVAP